MRCEPKINGSICRINRDVRFSKDKRPYKDHLDIWFWHGDKKGWDRPGFYLRITPSDYFSAVGMHRARGRDAGPVSTGAMLAEKPGSALD